MERSREVEQHYNQDEDFFACIFAVLHLGMVMHKVSADALKKCLIMLRLLIQPYQIFIFMFLA